eukprot:3909626-Prymnesium_polylepis.1
MAIRAVFEIGSTARSFLSRTAESVANMIASSAWSADVTFAAAVPVGCGPSISPAAIMGVRTEAAVGHRGGQLGRREVTAAGHLLIEAS